MLRTNVYINIKYEVSVNIGMCRTVIKEKYQNDCHLKTVVRMINIHIRYEVSIFNPVAGRAVHRH